MEAEAMNLRQLMYVIKKNLAVKERGREWESKSRNKLETDVWLKE